MTKEGGKCWQFFPQLFGITLLELKKVWVAIFDWETLENCLSFRFYGLSVNCGLLMKGEMLAVFVV